MSSSPTPSSYANEVDAETQRPDAFDIEKLGRQRPAVFPSALAEIGFGFSLLASMLMAEYFISGIHPILPPIAEDLSIPATSQTWPSSVFSLVTGALLLPFGRLGDMYGGYYTFNIGLAWFFVWSLVAGFSPRYIVLVVCRAMQGLGAAAVLPTGIMLLGRTYRPGPRKNLFFALYGAFAPIGFFIGILVGGAVGQYLNWRWYFWIGSIMVAVTLVVSLFTIPRDYKSISSTSTATMDWWGIATIPPGLILVVYAITDSSNAPQGWRTPYILVTLLLGVAFLAISFYVQGWVSKDPLLPADLFHPKGMKLLVLALWLVYGSFGLFLFYSTFYIELVMHASPLQTAVWFVPMITGGIIISTVGGFTLHLLPGRVLLILSGLGHVVCSLLFAVMPLGAGYWPFVFPAMIASTIGVDITYTVTNIFITTNLPTKYQGVAGALINSLLFLGISFWLGLGDVVVSATRDKGVRKSYQCAFWLAVGLAGIALMILASLNIGSAKSDLTVEEREALEKEAREAQEAAAVDSNGQTEIPTRESAKGPFV